MKSLRIGIVGTGGFALKHAQLLAPMEGVSIAGFVGTTLDKAEQAAARFSGAAGYEQLESLLDREKPDAVYLCVPPMAHGPLEQALIDRSVPFFVEKPLGTEAQTPDKLVEQIHRKQLITSVGYHWRYTDGVKKAKELLEGRKVGLVTGSWLGSMPRVGWWRTLKGSGGQFVEQTTHITDLVRHLCGDVSEVFAQYNQTVMQEQVEGTEVPDAGMVSLRMKSGVLASLTNTCLLPLEYSMGLNLMTDQGVLEIRANGIRDVRKHEITEYLNQTDPYVLENCAFLHAVRTGDSSQILSSYEDAHRTHQASIAANRSASLGAPVRL